MSRPAALARLLAGLVATDFRGDAVALQLSIDAPRPAGSNPKFDSMFPTPAAAAAAHARRAAGHAAVLALARNLTWPHGDLDLDVAPTPRGLVEQWVHGWRPPPGGREALLVLEDDLEVVGGWYGWLRARLDEAALQGGGAAAAAGPAAHLAGISLSLQNRVVGEAEAGAYERVDPLGVVRRGAAAAAAPPPPAYLAQQVSSWAPVLLPGPWRAFVAWFDGVAGGEGGGLAAGGAGGGGLAAGGEGGGLAAAAAQTSGPARPAGLSAFSASASAAAGGGGGGGGGGGAGAHPHPHPHPHPPRPPTPPTPCLPGLISNQWWRWDGSAIWTVWWHRWAYGAGAAFLYPTAEGGGAVAVNHMEPGEHFITKPEGGGGGGGGGGGRRADGGGGGDGGGVPPAPSSPPLPPLATLPLYDLHMRRVWGSPAGLLYRGAVLEGVGEEGLCRWVGE